MSRIIAWHFTAAKLRDGRPIPLVGEWLTHAGPVVMCSAGLHASMRALDALEYAPGPVAHLVECEDVVAMDSDKFVCRRRKILASVDATGALRSFSRRCALDVIHLWDAPDVVRRYLETGDETIRAAARAAAWEAAVAAAREAAREADRDAQNRRLEARLLYAMGSRHPSVVEEQSR